jgi:uncharacterized protein HemY
MNLQAGKLLFRALLLLMLGSLLFLLLRWTGPGYVLIAFAGYTFETTLLALLMAIVVVSVVLRSLQRLLGLLSGWRFWRRQQINKGDLK